MKGHSNSNLCVVFLFFHLCDNGCRKKSPSEWMIYSCCLLILSPRFVCWPASFPLLWSPCSCPTWTWPPCCTWRPPAGSCRRWSVTVASIPGDSGGWSGKRAGRRSMKRPETVRIANSNSSSTHTNSQDRNTFCQTTESHKISLFLGRQINFQCYSAEVPDRPLHFRFQRSLSLCVTDHRINQSSYFVSHEE